jgi:polysaccharide pyruvyl transferase WcaK-like protein
MQRRSFLISTAATATASSLVSALRAATAGAPAHIILRSSWQTVNIGDIAHTPGVLRILEDHLPEMKVSLWPSSVSNGVEQILAARFPNVAILKTQDQRAAAFKDADFLLHGSGPSLVARNDVERWRQQTGKPFGVYGITISGQPSTATSPMPEQLANTIETLSHASFTFFRDSRSLQLAKDLDCTCPIMEFGPDGAFATDLRDDAAATAFLATHGLEEGKFLCCIPRLRFTPYWVIPEKNAEPDPIKHARNEAMKEHDHAQLRQAILKIIAETDLKLLLCPEDQTQMAVAKELLFDPLPDEAKTKVVWRPDYWLTGEALSTYVRSAGLFGNEMHSPIMCIGNGVPAIVCRWAEQTSKGFMWQDIGLGDWLFDLDDPEDYSRVAPTIIAMAKDPQAAKEKAAKARAFVEARQQETMAVLGDQLA